VLSLLTELLFFYKKEINIKMTVIRAMKQTLKKMKKIVKMRVNEMNVLNNAFNIIKKIKKTEKTEQYKNADKNVNKNVNMIIKIDKIEKKTYIIISIVVSST